MVLRNLDTGVNTIVSEAAGNWQNDVAANGDVVYWGSAYQIFRYRQDSTTQITSDAGLWNTFPRTDGTNIVYRKHTPCCVNQEYQIAFYGASGEIILTSPGPQEPAPGSNYQVNNGWVAFTKPGPGGQLQVWTRSPSGQLTQVSYFGTSSAIEALGPNGEMAFLNAKRYLSISPYDTPPVVISSTTAGRSFWQNGDLFLTLGRSLFQVVP